MADQLRGLFAESVKRAFEHGLGRRNDDALEAYMTELLVRFVRTDAIYSIRDADGNPVESVSAMLAEGDVALNADSFEREREVHRHIGDFLMFWHGVNPEFLRRLKSKHLEDWVCDYEQQGRESYRVVSLFDLPPHDSEAPLFGRLSLEFDEGVYALRCVQKHLGPGAFGMA